MCKVEQERPHTKLASQCDLVKKILKEFNQLDKNPDECFKIINLIGEDGSGKSEICNLLLLDIPNKWSVHSIIAYEGESVPRASIQVKKRIEFFPSPSLTLRLGIVSVGSSLRFQEADAMFHDIEKQFLKEVKRDYGHSVILIENYHDLDELTKLFIKTICDQEHMDRFYKYFPVVFLITSDKKVFPRSKDFFMEKLDEAEIQQLAFTTYNKSISTQQARELKILTDGNLKFINNLLPMDDNFNSITLQEIIEKRIQDIIKSNILIQSYHDIESICICGAYFECGFTLNQIVKILPQFGKEQLYELFSKLENYRIVETEDQQINYTVEQFKQTLKNKRADLELFYFEKMYDFYTQNYDYDYETRLKFAVRLPGTTVRSKSIALLFKYVIQQIYVRTLKCRADLDSVLARYAKVSLPDEVHEVLCALIDNHLDDATITRATAQARFDNLLLAELLCLKMNFIAAYVQKTILMNEAIMDAIYLATILEQEGVERYALLNLRGTIVTHIINRSTLTELRNNQLNAYEKSLGEYKSVNADLYDAFIHVFYRKSALFNLCDKSKRDLYDACSYFRAHGNKYELYYSYVNLIGLLAVMDRSDTKEYRLLHQDVQKYLDENEGLQFKSKYKYDHNVLLNDYLKSYKKCSDKDDWREITSKFYKKYCSLYRKYPQNIIRINQVSLLCRLDPNKAFEEVNRFLKEVARERNMDQFYQFYLYSMRCMLYIVTEQWPEAEEDRNRLLKIPVPLFNGCESHLRMRHVALEKIIENRVKCASMLEYDNLIHQVYDEALFGLEHSFGQDESWEFFSKGFLLTDAQFFS